MSCQRRSSRKQQPKRGRTPRKYLCRGERKKEEETEEGENKKSKCCARCGVRRSRYRVAVATTSIAMPRHDRTVRPARYVPFINELKIISSTMLMIAPQLGPVKQHTRACFHFSTIRKLPLISSYANINLGEKNKI